MTLTVAIISATPLAVPPATDAITQILPAARIWNILDDRLLADAKEKGDVDAPLQQRMRRLIEHALGGSADAILLTCSLYGFITAEYSSAEIPVLAPDDAVFKAVAALAAPRVLVVGSLESAARDSADRLRASLRSAGTQQRVLTATDRDAMRLAESGTVQELAASIAATVQDGPDFDAVMLAQYSLSPAAQAVAAALGKPVLSGPHSAAEQLAAALGRAS
ncbi:aspartate/glutamate racemase family protein [Sciscionella sediminilitoris]|uniref:aspartate/glutamate racemase family protein n=1 Tax=Sciscionella sediminilitoris TaxID=1445613 RepID=UPI0004DF33FC|nr:aspartate/glutamate racemase family protein [Sciscionella sp. SE31]